MKIQSEKQPNNQHKIKVVFLIEFSFC